MVIPNAFALKCQTFNMQYKFCYEEWLTPTDAEKLASALDIQGVQNDLRIKSSQADGNYVLTISIKGDDLIDEISSLPYELREQGMTEVLGKAFGVILALAYSPFIADKLRKGLIPKNASNDVMEATIIRTKFQVDIQTDKGKSAKIYDISPYILQWYKKLGWFKSISDDDDEKSNDEE